MSLRLYMDHNIPGPITIGVRRKGIDVVTAEEDGRKKARDPVLLSRADELGRLFFSFDADLLDESVRRQIALEHFAGLAYADEWNVTFGQAIESLELMCVCYEPRDVENQVIYLPL